VTPLGCAYVPTLQGWLRDTGQWIGGKPPRAGDIAIFNWDGGEPDHAGIVERNLGDERFSSIEGPARARAGRCRGFWADPPVPRRPGRELHLREQ
jgi:hypothetical protein